MHKLPKTCFILSGSFLIIDGILIVSGINNIFGLPLPCPINLAVLGVGILSLALLDGKKKTAK